MSVISKVWRQGLVMPKISYLFWNFFHEGKDTLSLKGHPPLTLLLFDIVLKNEMFGFEVYIYRRFRFEVSDPLSFSSCGFPLRVVGEKFWFVELKHEKWCNNYKERLHSNSITKFNLGTKAIQSAEKSIFKAISYTKKPMYSKAMPAVITKIDGRQCFLSNTSKIEYLSKLSSLYANGTYFGLISVHITLQK